MFSVKTKEIQTVFGLCRSPESALPERKRLKVDFSFFEPHTGKISYSSQHWRSTGFKSDKNILSGLIFSKADGMVAVPGVFTGPQCWDSIKNAPVENRHDVHKFIFK